MYLMSKTPFLLPLYSSLVVRFSTSCARDFVADLENTIRTRCESRDISVTEALGFFNSMVDMRPIPSVRSFNRLFGAMSKMNQFSTVVSMYSHLLRFRSSHFHPNVVTLTIIIKCLCRSNNAKSGLCVFATMLKTGIRYDCHTLSTLLDGLCKAGEARNAHQLFEKMLGNGGVKPNVYCFAVLIDGLCKENFIDDALGLFRDMIDSGITPNAVCYNTIIHEICKAGRREEAKKLL